MKIIVLEACRDEDGKVYLIPERHEYVKWLPGRYPTYTEHVGVFTKVIVISEDIFTYEECRRLAICYVAGRYKKYTAFLNTDNPVWERVK